MTERTEFALVLAGVSMFSIWYVWQLSTQLVAAKKWNESYAIQIRGLEKLIEEAKVERESMSRSLQTVSSDRDSVKNAFDKLRKTHGDLVIRVRSIIDIASKATNG